MEVVLLLRLWSSTPCLDGLKDKERPWTCDPALLCDRQSRDGWRRQPRFALTRSSLYFGLLDSSFVRLKKAERELGEGGIGEIVTDIKCKFLQDTMLNPLLPRWDSLPFVFWKKHPCAVSDHRDSLPPSFPPHMGEQQVWPPTNPAGAGAQESCKRNATPTAAAYIRKRV